MSDGYITLSGRLEDPMDRTPDVGAQVRFTMMSNTGNSLKTATQTMIVDPSGDYDIELTYGNLLVEYKTSGDTEDWTELATVVINSDTVATTIPELISSSVPPTDENLAIMQQLFADAEEAANNAATSEANAAKSEANAATSETNASASEIAAADSATQAEIHEANAAASASAAATSEVNAKASEVAAALSETNAEASAVAASTSEMNAAASETATHADTVTTAADVVLAQDYAQTAQEYAENPEDTEVTTGEFSAKHWAQKAAKAATSIRRSGGVWTPTAGNEYPTPFDADIDEEWVVALPPTEPYTFTGGDLAGVTIFSTDLMIYDDPSDVFIRVPSPSGGAVLSVNGKSGSSIELGSADISHIDVDASPTTVSDRLRYLSTNKVDKVVGKALSTNDYSDAEKAKVAEVDSKVDKVAGKVLSTNDYSDADKAKVGRLHTPDFIDNVIDGVITRTSYETIIYLRDVTRSYTIDRASFEIGDVIYVYATQAGVSHLITTDSGSFVAPDTTSDTSLSLTGFAKLTLLVNDATNIVIASVTS